MIKRLLRQFPSQSYELTLVNDPDDLLADEGILAALDERGFTLFFEADPVRLRRLVAHFGNWSPSRPLVIVTSTALESLPYDLWQQGHRVSLALHSFFPLLSYPVIKTLTPAQRWRLAQAPPPNRRLGRQATMDYLLKFAFDAEVG